jgi:hypothetical protein
LTGKDESPNLISGNDELRLHLRALFHLGGSVGRLGEEMSRSCQRVRLESGLRLDINRLARRGFIEVGAVTGPVGIRWTNTYYDEEIANGVITADMSGTNNGWLRIQIGSTDQWIDLIARPRHFGGRQWFFLCPYLYRRAMVLWMPPGARTFACRQKWGRQVAYLSQFLDRDNRAHRGQAKIRSRLCSIGGLDPEEWDFPPKPKWMRWKTYNRAEEKFDRYEAILDEGVVELAARLGMNVSSK